jgi:hypothetical protein
LTDLQQLIASADPVARRQTAARIAAAASAAVNTRFLGNGQVITAEAVTAQIGDEFPTGSAGAA